MATVNANRPCAIAFDDGTRVDLRVGLNEDVPDKIKKHPYFKALAADGDVHLVAPEAIEEAEEAEKDDQQEEKPKRGRAKKDKEQAEQQEESAPVEIEQEAE